MRRFVGLMFVALLVGAVPAGAQPPLSDQGKQAFNVWHLAQGCDIAPPGMPPGYLASLGSRRLNTQAITWRIPTGPGQSQFTTSAPTVMANVASRLTGVATVTQVAAGDSTAHIAFRTGNSFVAQNGQTIPVLGCAADPRFNIATPATLTGINIWCKAGGGVTVLTHEVEWHGLFTWCHMSQSNTCGGQSANQMPPPDGNCKPGQIDAVRWIYQVPPGSFPQ